MDQVIEEWSFEDPKHKAMLILSAKMFSEALQHFESHNLFACHLCYYVRNFITRNAQIFEVIRKSK